MKREKNNNNTHTYEAMFKKIKRKTNNTEATDRKKVAAKCQRPHEPFQQQQQQPAGATTTTTTSKTLYTRKHVCKRI